MSQVLHRRNARGVPAKSSREIFLWNDLGNAGAYSEHCLWGGATRSFGHGGSMPGSSKSGCLLLVLLLVPGLAMSHSGGLNAEGCHTNRKTGDYHCHRAPAPARASASRLDATPQEPRKPGAAFLQTALPPERLAPPLFAAVIRGMARTWTGTAMGSAVNRIRIARSMAEHDPAIDGSVVGSQNQP